jgi:hypothetical protein
VAYRALQDFLSTLHDGERAYEAAARAMALELYGRACAEVGKARFLDKTPRYYNILPELARVFPRARFVILLRNPAAVLSSILRTWIKGNWVRFDYFRDDLLVAPTLLAQFMADFPERAIVIHYEALVSAPEGTVRMLCDRLGIAFHEDLLQYGQRKQPSGRYGDPSGIRQHDRPSAVSLDTWRERSADPQVRHLLLAYLDALGPDLIARLGYDANELAGVIHAVPVHSGKPTVTWEQLLKPDKTRAERLSLILAETRRERNPGHMIRQLWRLLANRY